MFINIIMDESKKNIDTLLIGKTKKQLTQIIKNKGWGKTLRGYSGWSKAILLRQMRRHVNGEPLQISVGKNYWREALKAWNSDKPAYCIPKKNTEGYNEILALAKKLKAPSKLAADLLVKRAKENIVKLKQTADLSSEMSKRFLNPDGQNAKQVNTSFYMSRLLAGDINLEFRDDNGNRTQLKLDEFGDTVWTRFNHPLYRAALNRKFKRKPENSAEYNLLKVMRDVYD